MARVNQLVSNFVNGQLSPRLAARTDAEAYRQGARSLLNAAPMTQGGWRKRGGTWVRAGLDAPARVEGRVFGRSEAYVFAFWPDKWAAYRAGADTLTEVASGINAPWTADTIWTMTMAWFGNLCVICDAAFSPRVLTRTGPDAFSFAELAFDTDGDGVTLAPRHKYAPDGVTIGASNSSGTVTLTASADLFTANHVGTVFALRGGFVAIAAVTDARTATAQVLVKLRQPFDPNPYYVTAGSTRVVVTLVDHGLAAGDSIYVENTAELGADVDGNGGVTLNGGFTVDEVLDRSRFVITNATAPAETEDGGGAGGWVYASSPSRDWKEPAFSQERGWPQACAFHGGRLWLGGSPWLGDAAFGSVARAFFAFDEGDGDPDDAVQAIGETQTNAIRHLMSAGDLLALGDTGEAYYAAGDRAPLNQANIEGKPSGRIGSAYVAPLAYDGAALFVDALGQHVYEFSYVEQFAAYVASPLSALCPEVLDRPIHATVWQGAPSTASAVALYANMDGTAALYHGRRAEQVAGWAPWRTAGSFVSFAGVGERLFACVERNRDGSPVWQIEEFDFDALYLDGAVRLTSGTPATAWTAGTFGVGAMLDMTDGVTGQYLGRVFTGAGGSFSTPVATTAVVVGRPYTCEIETMPPPWALPEGPQLGEIVAIPRAVVQFHETAYARVNESTFTAQEAAEFDEPLIPYSGAHEVWSLGWSRDKTVRIVSDLPLPMAVLGVLQEVVGGQMSFGGR